MIVALPTRAHSICHKAKVRRAHIKFNLDYNDILFQLIKLHIEANEIRQMETRPIHLWHLYAVPKKNQTKECSACAAIITRHHQ